MAVLLAIGGHQWPRVPVLSDEGFKIIRVNQNTPANAYVGQVTPIDQTSDLPYR